MIQFIKEKIKELYVNKTTLHIRIKQKNRSSQYLESEFKILEMYGSFFIVIDLAELQPKRYSIQYAEILTKEVVIKEIGTLPEIPKY